MKECSMCQISVLINICAIYISVTVASIPSETYLETRERILTEENASFTGNNITLSQKELEVDKNLRSLKLEELERGYKNSSDFLPSLSVFHSREQILKSKVFDFIQKVPKGASLHTHLLAGVNVNFIIKNFTYRENLYGGYINNVFKLKFFLHPDEDQGNWTLIKDMRESNGTSVFDEWLRKQLTLTDDLALAPAEDVWTKFKKTFTTLYDMISYKPVFQEYIHQLLQELYDDNVFYTELKGTIMQLYDLNGTTYTKRDFFEIFIDAVQQFKKEYPSFIGVRYIHSIYRGVDSETLKIGLEEIIEIKKDYPDFIAGFDFVGYEEEGHSLLDYSPQLLDVQNQLKFFFHAGETNWFGHTDLNLLDAILLNSTRIGHGFSLIKHPKMLQLAKDKNIALEICPISNQVLKLVDDLRNHPAAALMALDYPIVVCNDDPSVWNASGLSFDWYVLFMAMTPKNYGLEVLKQLAINSITYSSMTEEQRLTAMSWWQKNWNDFIENALKSKF